jgi:hypothetical protein
MHLWIALWCQLLVDVCTYPQICKYRTFWEYSGYVFIIWFILTCIVSKREWWVHCWFIGIFVSLPCVPNTLVCIVMLYLRCTPFTMLAHSLTSMFFWILFRLQHGSLCNLLFLPLCTIIAAIMLMYTPQKRLQYEMNTTNYIGFFIYCIYSISLTQQEHLWISTKIGYCLCGLFALFQPIKQV